MFTWECTRRQACAVWTYTHRWREIPRAAFGEIAVLASIERPGEAGAALEHGYAPAVTVPEFPDGRRVFELGDGWRGLPCPYEANANVTCVTCRLCFDDEKLRRRRLAIAFAVHGRDSAEAKRRLRVLA